MPDTVLWGVCVEGGEGTIESGNRLDVFLNFLRNEKYLRGFFTYQLEASTGKKNKLHQEIRAEDKNTWPRLAQEGHLGRGGKDVTGTILGEGLPVSQKKTCKGPTNISKKILLSSKWK